MSDDLDNSLHDLIVTAFIRYCTANEKFEHFGFIQSAVEARAALNQVAALVKDRRKQIQAKRFRMHGNTAKGTAPTAPNERRQRKLDRQRQKTQADQDNSTN